MGVRILCLHGQGVNSTIFAAQTASFRALLPANYEFVFVDGPTACEAAPGVADVYHGPYLCWYSSPTASKVAAAHELISTIIQRDGPFDAVMGFSQGAALAASMIIHDQLARPSGPPLFRAAIFICSPIPFSYSLDHGIDTRAYFGVRTRAPSRPNCPTTIPKYLITDAAYLKGEETSELNESDPTRRFNHTYYQMFHPTVDDVRIAIPTAHVFGRKDSWRRHSMDLLCLCRGDRVSVFEHDGGHEVPRSVSEEICDTIEATIFRM